MSQSGSKRRETRASQEYITCTQENKADELNSCSPLFTFQYSHQVCHFIHNPQSISNQFMYIHPLVILTPSPPSHRVIETSQ
ncbi:hypothetical protein GDO81_002446 [Engystomops pustulosus]|nr:hypothetical protein GDO81_002446 [Engystomops pustulosus]